MVKVSLKSVLRNFLNHYQTLESRHKLSLNSNDDSIDLYIREFQALKELTESLKTDPNCGSIEGENDVNKRKNRYKDILPYDHSRVILSEYPGVPGSDYMNANYVRGSSGLKSYIAAQGPLPNTVVDFWRMIWESDVTVIVMACNEREAGKYKCESYWPQDNEERQQYGNITVELVKWRQLCPDFLVRTLKVTADSTERTVCQFHYQTWPDHGVPTSVHPILELVRLMRDVQASEARPILIHCSAGCGRTGTICSIDYVWALLRTGKLREDFSLFSIIKEMRKQRIAMVQTVEQYMLCYKAVATLFEQQLKMIDAHTYENIDCDGEPLMRKELLDDVNQQMSSNDSSDNNDSIDNEDRKDSVLCAARNNVPQNIVKPISESISTPNATNSVNHCEEVRHERLVGKATVIRRPSIAKLKAIFENQNAVSEPPIVRSRSTSSSLQRSHSIKDNSRNSRSLIEGNQQEFISNESRNEEIFTNSEQILPTNYYEQQKQMNINFQGINQIHKHSDQNQQQLYSEYNPLIHKLEPSQTFQSNQRQVIEMPQFSAQTIHSSQLADQKFYHQNHQQLQQQIRQHFQQQQQQVHQSSQLALASHSMPPQSQMHSSAPPKPPRTYQHIVDETFNSLPNPSEGRLIVSVALPRRQSNDVNPNIQNNIYEPLGQRRCNISSPNLVSDSVLVNSEHLNDSYVNNMPKMINISNTNIYESVLPKYRTQPLEPNGVSLQNTRNHNNFTQSYFDVMKLRNNGLNSTLPFYDTIYGRRGFMTVPNLRHIQVPVNPVSQVQCSYPQFKPNNYENIYSTNIPNNNNNNNNNVNRSEKSNTDRIAANFVRNVDKTNDNNICSEQLSKQNKTNLDEKERNIANNCSVAKNTTRKNELTKNLSSGCASNSHSLSQQELNSGTFSKFTNAFKGFRIKSTKTKNKTTSNTNNTANNVNGPIIARPPHSHRFSPPTQWTQV